MNKGVIGIIVTLSVCVVIVIIVLIACSYRKVDVNEVALLYSHAARKIDREQLYTGGRYYVGVGGEFITFPVTLQEMPLPVFESRTMDGLKISLEVSLSYKFEKNRDKIIDIYDHFGAKCDGFISRLAMNIVRDASARYKAYSYSINRSQVSYEMERDMRDDMADFGLILESLQLLNVAFPKNFTTTLSNTLLLQQQVSQAERDMAAELVSLEGELSKSNITAAGLISDAMSQATTILQTANATALSLAFTLEKEGAAHKSMIDMFKKQSGVTDEKAQDLFVKWYWMNQISASSASKNFATSIPSGLDDA